METPLPNSRKVLLIGWDAADWNVALPLMEAGKMPNLQKLCDDGVWGNLATIRPVLSPMLWTSIATGKRAWKHGIHGFTEPCPNSGGIRPITNLSRKTKAVWNILNQQGWKSNVIGWWPSSPAEPINGVMVSNHYQQAGKPVDEEWPMMPGTVHPKELEEPLKSLRVHPAELGNEHILPFIPKAGEIDQDKDKRMEGCAKTIAEITGIHAAATACMQLEPWDFMAVYYDGIDHFGHGFMKYHPPRQPWVNETDFELYKNVIESGYRYHDMMLGVLLELASEDTTVMLISDHGFESGNLRPQHLPNEPAGPAAEHSHYGVFCMKGPGVKSGERIYGASLLDITPTLLHLYGLPVGEDMDGKVLVNCFEEEQSVEFIESWDSVKGEDGRHPAGEGFGAVESRESMKQLIDLGYIDEPNPDKGKAIDESIRELQYNLVQAYMDGGLYLDAAKILKVQWERWPEESRFGTKLLSCYLALKDATESRSTFDLLKVRKEAAMVSARAELKEMMATRAEHEAKRKKDAEEKGETYEPQPLPKGKQQRQRKLRDRSTMNQNALSFLEGSVLALEEDYEAALEKFKAAEKVQNSQRPDVFSKIGDMYYALENWTEAAVYHVKAIHLSPNYPNARLGLARVYLKQSSYFEAAAEALAALELQFHNPVAHFVYATALIKLGKLKMAEQSLLTAVGQNGNYVAALRRLSTLYENRLKEPEKAQQYRALADAAEERVAERRAGTAEDTAELDVVFPVVQNVGGRLTAEDGEPLIVVSGLPRSGTSLMMQMLDVGGVEMVTDKERAADDSNPKGYFEDERVKQLASKADRTWLDECNGKAIKIVAPLLGLLPKETPVKVIFMQRDAREVIDSQRAMLERDGKHGATVDDSSVASVFAAQLEAVNSRVIEGHPKMEILVVDFAEAVNQPTSVAKSVNEFLGGSLEEVNMVTVADERLYRSKY